MSQLGNHDEQSNIHWLNEAYFLAERAAAEDEVPVGALVVFEGRIIGQGYNQREQKQDPLAHAEMLAIRQASLCLASWRLNECLLVSTLEPCPMCLAASQQARIKNVIYGAHDPKGGALSLGYRLNEDLRTHHRFTVTHVDFPPCSQILKDFFEKKRRP